MGMSDSPVAKLIDGVVGHLVARRQARDVIWKFPEPHNGLRRKAAQAVIIREETAIEHKIRTWVYGRLILEIKQMEAYKDPGHFGNHGVQLVIQHLQKNRPELKGNEGE